MQLSTVRALVTGGASGLGEGTVRAIVAAGGMATIIDLATSKGAQLAAAALALLQHGVLQRQCCDRGAAAALL